MPTTGAPATGAGSPSFWDLALHKNLFKALKAIGFTAPTEVQAAAIPLALAGRDLMVSAKTGSGKSAAFLLPMLHHMLEVDAPDSGTRALILLPTRELALQTRKMFESLRQFTQIRCGLVIGGEPFKHQIAALRKNPEIIIGTPGRLVEHLDKGSIDFNDLEILVLDEADRMLDMGFAEDMNRIAEACRKERQTLLFSATLKHQGIDRILQILHEPVSIEVDSFKAGHSQIRQQIVLADDDNHKLKLIQGLLKEEGANKVFVFCKTRDQCEQVGARLRDMEIKVGFIHGEIAQSERKQALNRFRDNKLQVLVATDVASRGLDVQDVDLVINYTVAHSGDDHVHRVGRTGRAGKEGLAITLVNAFEWNKMSSIERYLKIHFERRQLDHLKAKYTGPKKLKSSGKAASTKKKSDKKAEKKKAAHKPAKKKHAARKLAEKRELKKGAGKPARETATADKPAAKSADKPTPKAKPKTPAKPKKPGRPSEYSPIKKHQFGSASDSKPTSVWGRKRDKKET